MNIFISHIHEESAVADAIKHELEQCFAAQVQVFLARDIPLGANWFLEIREALQKADLILGLFSHTSKGRPWINIEAGYGVMSEKRVIPMCLPGLEMTDLPIVYGLQQAMNIADRKDVSRLLEEIASATPAKRLLIEKDAAIERWVSGVSRAAAITPSYSASADEPPFVWIIGSDRDLPEDKSLLAFRVAETLAPALVENKFRVVFGRSRLLSYIADRIGVQNISDGDFNIRGERFLNKFALESARANEIRRSPTPLIFLGSLRSPQGVRAIFMETLGRIPDIVILIGGGQNGRALEESAAAQSAQIPILPIEFTGGAASQVHPSLHESLEREVAALQKMDRDRDRLGTAICDIIKKQTALNRAVHPA
jgi:hypothetical protein